ncbi:TolC family protein [Deinococcus sp. YIM 77859]|uniref:TolC family protein n=1 Tax=Deinococcus sp. YIM 77859 TaxID=1540221 RepID=UPI0005590B78|nr:TolC family protein [Deinococcus sp. YIM 77859]
MNSSPSALLLVLTLLALPGAAAQVTAPVPVQTPAPLTLTSTLERLRESPGWRSADLQYRSAQLALDRARARAGLNVTASADAAAVKLPLGEGSFTVTPTLTVQASASVLPWSPALEGVRSAERAASRAALDLRSARLSLVVNAVQAYWTARNAAANQALAEAQLALAARQLGVAQAQRAAGMLAPEALLAREGALEDARAAQRQARLEVDLAARGLANLLGQPVTLPTDAAAFGPLPAVPAPPGPLESLVARALAARPEVTRAENDLADAQAQLRSAQLDARLPDVTASVQYGQLGSTQTSAGRVVGGSLNLKAGVLAAQASFPLRDPGERPTGLALGLSGSFPVVGGEKGAVLAAAEVGVELAQLALETARQSVDLEVRQRAADLARALDSLDSGRSALARAQAALTTAQARLSAGLATELDVEAAKLGVQQAGLAVERATVQAHLASLRLAQATGELDPTLLVTPIPEARP